MLMAVLVVGVVGVVGVVVINLGVGGGSVGGGVGCRWWCRR